MEGLNKGFHHWREVIARISLFMMALNMNYNSVNDIKQLLVKYGITLKKRWGQNFLINAHVREKMIDLLGIRPDDTVWEVGPGIGHLTNELVNRVEHLYLFEIDHGLVRVLSDIYGEREEISIFAGDFIKTWQAKKALLGSPNKIVGNLPYSSGSAIILNLIKKSCLSQRMVFTLQREVAQRMTADPGKKNYSLFSVICQSALKIENCGDIQPGAFYPQPEVISRVIRCTPASTFQSITDKELFFTLVEQLFLSRRKKIKNNLLQDYLLHRFFDHQLLSCLSRSKIDPSDRIENIDLERLITLSNCLADCEKS